jgi:hypothetical protein
MKTLSTLLLLISVSGPFGVLAMDDSVEGSRITENTGGQFSYNYFNHHPEVIEFFESKGLQGGGYTWEALAKSGLELNGSKLVKIIEFDSEGDALFAYSPSRPALEELEAVLKKLSSDTAFRDKCLTLAEERGDLE